MPATLVFSLYDPWHGHPARDVHGQDGHATPSVIPWRQHIGCARRKQPVMGFFRAVSARVSIRPSEDGSPDSSIAGPSGRRIPLFPARSREPAAGSQETVASGEWLVVSNRWPLLSGHKSNRLNWLRGASGSSERFICENACKSGVFSKSERLKICDMGNSLSSSPRRLRTIASST